MKKFWPLNLIVGAFLALVAAFIAITNFAPQKGLPEDIACGLVFSGAFMVGATVVTVLICHRQAKQRHQISRLTGWFAGILSMFVTTFSGCLLVRGMRVFTADFFAGYFLDWRWQLLWLWGFAISTLVAFGVVVYHRRRFRDDTHMA